MDGGHARTIAFTALIVGNIALILTNLSWSLTIPQSIKVGNRALWWVVAGAFAFLVLAIYVPFLRGLFNFVALTPLESIIGILAGGVSIIWFEILKAVLVGRGVSLLTPAGGRNYGR